jgi:hypothetical protein
MFTNKYKEVAIIFDSGINMGVLMMSNKNTKRTMEEMAGIEMFVDSRGARWRLRVFTLGDLWRFYDVLEPVLVSPDAKAWEKLLQTALMVPEPGLMVRLRRALGYDDYSVGRITRAIPVKDAMRLLDAVVRANLDMTLDKLKEKCEKIMSGNEKEKGKVEGNGTGAEGQQDWGSVVGYVFVEKSVMPGEFFGLTVRQFNAILGFTEKAGRRRMDEEYMSVAKKMMPGGMKKTG